MAAPKKLGEPVLRGPAKVLERALQAFALTRIRPVVRKERTACVLRVSRSSLKRAQQLLSEGGFRRWLVSDLDRAYGFCSRCRAALPVGANWCRRCGEFAGDAHAM